MVSHVLEVNPLGARLERENKVNTEYIPMPQSRREKVPKSLQSRRNCPMRYTLYHNSRNRDL
jgi:hypothetical protein